MIYMVWWCGLCESNAHDIVINLWKRQYCGDQLLHSIPLPLEIILLLLPLPCSTRASTPGGSWWWCWLSCILHSQSTFYLQFTVTQVCSLCYIWSLSYVSIITSFPLGFPLGLTPWLNRVKWSSRGKGMLCNNIDLPSIVSFTGWSQCYVHWIHTGQMLVRTLVFWWVALGYGLYLYITPTVKIWIKITQ